MKRQATFLEDDLALSRQLNLNSAVERSFSQQAFERKTKTTVCSLTQCVVQGVATQISNSHCVVLVLAKDDAISGERSLALRAHRRSVPEFNYGFENRKARDE